MKMHSVAFVGLAISIAAAGTLQSATAATLCVNPGGTSGCYSTVGAAVVRAQMDYTDDGTIDRIEVAPGTYMEEVKIETPLSLVGAGSGRSIHQGRISMTTSSWVTVFPETVRIPPTRRPRVRPG